MHVVLEEEGLMMTLNIFRTKIGGTSDDVHTPASC